MAYDGRVATPILATKLHVPAPRAKLVQRPQLIDRLNQALERGPGLSLISAPAGFGKTTLLAAWAAECEWPVAWLSLDEADGDPARFVAYLIAALQAIDGGLGKGALRMLEAPQPPAAETLLTVVLNEIAAMPNGLALVLDDYHLVDSKSIDAALSFLLEHLPPRMLLVIATRADPDLPLARLRGRGQLTELRAVELRFTPVEAAEFLNRVMGLSLSADEVAALEARTEGWIAGLQLAAVSMQGSQDAAGFVQAFTGSHRFVMDYLVEEVLRQQSDRVQDFLLSTSILERLCGALCDHLLPDHAAPGQETLEQLESANLLTNPLDDQRQWYRYHHLFAEALSARLAAERPGQVPELHRQASDWFDDNGFRPEAIRHALAAEDYPRAAEMIELDFLEKSSTYYLSDTWYGWVRALPEELVRSNARLSLGYAWELLFRGDFDAAGARLEEAAGEAARMPESAEPPQAASTEADGLHAALARPPRASIALAQAFLAQALGDLAGTGKNARRAIDLAPEANLELRGLANSLLAMARWTTGDLDAAAQHISEAIANMRSVGNYLFATSGAYVLGQMRIAQGRLSEAVHIYGEALRYAEPDGEPPLQGAADLHLGLSELHRQRGDVQAAGEHLQRAEQLGQPAALPEWPLPLYLAQARAQQDQGNSDRALELLEQAERLFSPGVVPDVRPIAALKARVWIRQVRDREARDWARRRGLSADDDLSYLCEFEHLTLARLLIAGDDGGPQALALLQGLLDTAEAGGRLGSVIEILALQALGHQALGDLPPALESLERAVTLAEPEGYVRVFVDEGKPVAELLRRLVEGGRVARTLPDAVRAHALSVMAAFESGESSPFAGQPLIEPLSPRELEVLQLIAQGLSNQQIAEQLYLAESTVKGHNSRIFGKLGVRRRTEAVARARQLGLLETTS